MKKVELTMNEHEKYEKIKQLVENGVTPAGKKRVAAQLGFSIQHIGRLVKRYQEEGKAAFSHKNKGTPPAHALDFDTRKLIIDLYRTKYDNSNFTHFNELLKTHEDIYVSDSTIRNILDTADILPPKAWRQTRKKHKAKLKARQAAAKTKKEKEKIQDAINTVDDPHPRRPRCSYFGEMIQMDASVHLWFGDEKTHLHAAIDDSTGRIVGAYFAPQETLDGYYQVFHQILTTYGIPAMFYTDRRTVFEYKQKKAPSLAEDTFTQFSYACKQLGVDIKTTSQAQSKGRIERLFQTLQSRLPIELNLAGATTLAEANEFLNSYIKKFNQRFTLPIHVNKSVFEKQPSVPVINHTLSRLSLRKIDTGHCIRFKNKYYRPLSAAGSHANFYKGTEVIVIEAFDGQLLASINDRVFAMDQVPLHEEHSAEFDSVPAPPKKKRLSIPEMTHPWRLNSFYKHLDSMPHQLSFSELSNTQAHIFADSSYF